MLRACRVPFCVRADRRACRCLCAASTDMLFSLSSGLAARSTSSARRRTSPWILPSCSTARDARPSRRRDVSVCSVALRRVVLCFILQLPQPALRVEERLCGRAPARRVCRRRAVADLRPRTDDGVTLSQVRYQRRRRRARHNHCGAGGRLLHKPLEQPRPARQQHGGHVRRVELPKAGRNLARRALSVSSDTQRADAVRRAFERSAKRSAAAARVAALAASVGSRCSICAARASATRAPDATDCAQHACCTSSKRTSPCRDRSACRSSTLAASAAP